MLTRECSLGLPKPGPSLCAAINGTWLDNLQSQHCFHLATIPASTWHSTKYRPGLTLHCAVSVGQYSTHRTARGEWPRTAVMLATSLSGKAQVSSGFVCLRSTLRLEPDVETSTPYCFEVGQLQLLVISQFHGSAWMSALSLAPWRQE